MPERKILSSDGESTFAIAISDKTIEIKRRDQKFTITGNDFMVVGTSRKGDKATSLIVKDGKLDDSTVTFAKDEDLDDNGEPKPKKKEDDKPDEKQDEDSEDDK
jgi:hypothetical protein